MPGPNSLKLNFSFSHLGTILKTVQRYNIVFTQLINVGTNFQNNFLHYLVRNLTECQHERNFSITQKCVLKFISRFFPPSVIKL